MRARLADPQVVGAVRSLLREGRENARAGWSLREGVRAMGIPCDSTRRVQEAIRHLRIAEHLTIASGPEGYWIERDPKALSLALVTHRRRVAASAEVIRAIDPALADRLTLALELGA
jgi:hypothetical protein